MRQGTAKLVLKFETGKAFGLIALPLGRATSLVYRSPSTYFLACLTERSAKTLASFAQTKVAKGPFALVPGRAFCVCLCAKFIYRADASPTLSALALVRNLEILLCEKNISCWPSNTFNAELIKKKCKHITLSMQSRAVMAYAVGKSYPICLGLCLSRPFRPCQGL
jgi:hypothetical protein